MCKHDPIYRLENEVNGGFGCPPCAAEHRDAKAAATADEWLDWEAIEAIPYSDGLAEEFEQESAKFQRDGNGNTGVIVTSVGGGWLEIAMAYENEDGELVGDIRDSLYIATGDAVSALASILDGLKQCPERGHWYKGKGACPWC